MTEKTAFKKIAEEFCETRGLDKFEFVGKGAFKETFKVSSKNGDCLALKIADPEKIDSHRSEREISALKRCNINLIGKLYDYGEFQSKANGKYLFFLEEYLDGGTLSDKIRNGVLLSPDIVKEYAISLIQALDYLRGINLVHRDIKPDNIMFRKNFDAPVLVDFGIVRDLSESSITQTWLGIGPGTPYFAAPEQLNNEKELIKWRTDQFSLGIVLSICLTGNHPFWEPGKPPNDAILAVAQKKRCSQEFRKKITDMGFEGILKMIEPWPVRRYNTPKQLLEYFKNKE